MKATDVIKRDHQAAKDLFSQYKEAPEDERQDLADKIFNALATHEKMEDTYFYPVLLTAAPAKDKKLFEDMNKEQGELESKTTKARSLESFAERNTALLELMDEVLAHAGKEEAEVLPKAEDILSNDRLEELGGKMEPESAAANG